MKRCEITSANEGNVQGVGAKPEAPCNDIVHVAFASDDNYFEGLLVAAVSMAVSCSRPSSLVMHILDGGISDRNWSRIESLLSGPGCRLDRIVVRQEAQFGNLRAYHGNGRMTYARLVLPECLPDVSYIVYSDVDVIWCADVAELWRTIDKNACLGYAAPIAHSFAKLSEKDESWFVANGYPRGDAEHFCAGMLVLNLDKFRGEKLHSKMLDLLEQHKGVVPCVDEGAINAIVRHRNDIQRFDHRWLLGTGDVSILPHGETSFVLHYACDTPWKSLHAVHHMLTDSILLWHTVHAFIIGKTVWQSLRTCNSPFSILAGRVLFKMASNLAPVRWLLKMAMILRGHRKGIPCLMAFVAKPVFSYGDMFDRLRERVSNSLRRG